MEIYKYIFPENSRTFNYKRWFKICLRTIHLIGISGMGSGYYFRTPEKLLLPFIYLTIFSGILLVFLEIWSNGIWLIQLRGIAIYVKLILLATLPLISGHPVTVLIIVIVISGLISHAPGDVRYYSLLHGKRIEKLPAFSTDHHPD